MYELLLLLVIVVYFIFDYSVYRIKTAFLIGYEKGYNSTKYDPDKAYKDYTYGDYY